MPSKLTDSAGDPGDMLSAADVELKGGAQLCLPDLLISSKVLYGDMPLAAIDGLKASPACHGDRQPLYL